MLIAVPKNIMGNQIGGETRYQDKLIQHSLGSNIRAFNLSQKSLLIDGVFTSYLFSEPILFVKPIEEVTLGEFNEEKDKLNNRIRRIARKFREVLDADRMPFKIKTTDGNAVLYLKMRIFDSDTRYHIAIYGTLMTSDGFIENQIFTIPFIRTNFNEINFLEHPIMKPSVFIGQTPNKNLVKWSNDNKFFTSIAFSTMLIEGIKAFDEDIIVDDPDTLVIDNTFDYTDWELKCFQAIHKECLADCKPDERKKLGDHIVKMIDHYGDTDVPGYSNRLDPPVKFFDTDVQPNDPLVDLSTKEFNFVVDYSMEHGFAIGQECNMAACLLAPRYGYRLHYPISKGRQKILFDTQIDMIGTNECILTMVSKNDLFQFIMKFHFVDLEHFTITDFRSVKYACAYLRFKEMNIHGSKEIDSKLPNELSDRGRFIGFAYDVMGLYLLMHDRPERLQQVTCTEDTEYKQKVHRNGKLVTQKKTKTTVVARLLKTPTKARKYVAEKMKHSRADAHYILDQWETKAHTRTLKSGRVVMVSAHTKHRKKKTDTEVNVIIKL